MRESPTVKLLTCNGRELEIREVGPPSVGSQSTRIDSPVFYRFVAELAPSRPLKLPGKVVLEDEAW
jgi:hypothetical protein